MIAPNRLGEAPVKSLFPSGYVPAMTIILCITAREVSNAVILGRTVGREGGAAVGLRQFFS